MGDRNAKRAGVLLAVDVGNTRTSLGVFDGDELLATWTLTTPSSLTADEAARRRVILAAQHVATPLVRSLESCEGCIRNGGRGFHGRHLVA